MINLPEREDDIYLNALTQIMSRSRDAKLAFDLDAYNELCRIVVSEVKDRLGELFFEDDTKARPIIDLAEELFIRGWERERGMHGSVDCEAAAQLYSQAVGMCHDEAGCPLHWG